MALSFQFIISKHYICIPNLKTMKKTLLIFVVFFSVAFTAFSQEDNKKWSIALHGGAGGAPTSMTPEKKAIYENHLLEAIKIGEKMLINGKTALEAVESVVVYLEDCPLFNAGKGAVKTIDGTHELDAAIMDGSNLKAGAVAGLKDIKNPIKAARLVKDSTAHVLLIGEGASSFAKSMGLEVVENTYFSTKQREEQFNRIKENSEKSNPMGTVGCVALDIYGNLAAATSTGGMSGKKWGRVGDVPIIGAGTYANNNTAAISGTGHGELWIRRVVAFDICALMDYKGMSLEDAANEVIFNKIDPMGGSGGGIIAVDKAGNISFVFNTGLMHRAWSKSNGEYGVGVLKGEQKIFKN